MKIFFNQSINQSFSLFSIEKEKKKKNYLKFFSLNKKYFVLINRQHTDDFGFEIKNIKIPEKKVAKSLTFMNKKTNEKKII